MTLIIKQGGFIWVKKSKTTRKKKKKIMKKKKKNITNCIVIPLRMASFADLGLFSWPFL